MALKQEHAKNNKSLLLINFHLKESDTKERGARHKKKKLKGRNNTLTPWSRMK